MRILVVDDDASIQDVVDETLQRGGYSNVIFASSGAEALEMIRGGRHFDLVITDWNMGPVSGPELFSETRSYGIPFILLSGQLSDDDILEFRSRGFAAVMRKPYDVREFLQAVAAILRPDAVPAPTPA